jgi:hypothetical protein
MDKGKLIIYLLIRLVLPLKDYTYSGNQKGTEVGLVNPNRVEIVPDSVETDYHIKPMWVQC